MAKLNFSPVSFRSIPSQGNKAELVFTVLHRNKLGLDDFLGQVMLPLRDMDMYENPRSRWCKLSSKQNKENKKERGELEIRIAFTVKAGSLNDLSKTGKSKSKTSLSNLSFTGGSLLSLRTLEKRKGIKSFAKAVSNKLKKPKDKNSSSGSINEDIDFKSNRNSFTGSSSHGYHDPGTISENEDEFAFENLSQKGSDRSLNVSQYGKSFSDFKVSEQNIPEAMDHEKTSSPSEIIKIDQARDEWQEKLVKRRNLTLPRKLAQSSPGTEKKEIVETNQHQEHINNLIENKRASSPIIKAPMVTKEQQKLEQHYNNYNKKKSEMDAKVEPVKSSPTTVSTIKAPLHVVKLYQNKSHEVRINNYSIVKCTL